MVYLVNNHSKLYHDKKKSIYDTICIRICVKWVNLGYCYWLYCRVRNSRFVSLTKASLCKTNWLTWKHEIFLIGFSLCSLLSTFKVDTIQLVFLSVLLIDLVLDALAWVFVKNPKDPRLWLGLCVVVCDVGVFILNFETCLLKLSCFTDSMVGWQCCSPTVISSEDLVC